MLNNRASLYLDFYPAIENIKKPGKTTRRLFLNLFVYTPIQENKKGRPVYSKDAMENQYRETHNLNHLATAQQILYDWKNKLFKPEIYTGHEKQLLQQKEKGEQNFVAYFKQLADKKLTSNKANWQSAYFFLEKYTHGHLSFNQLSVQWCEDFKEYLLSTNSNKSEKFKLSQNSALSYFNKVKAALKEAYKQDFLTSDLNAKVKPIKMEDTFRNFLTLAELQTLAQTSCKYPVLKQAAIFSALTGLRFSDIENLKWQDIHQNSNEAYSIHYRQQKTKSAEILPVSKSAIEILGAPGMPAAKVFTGLTYSLIQNNHLHHWVIAAGISKKITFHCFRHTYATLQLQHGTDLYTVSKLLGHKNVSTTQIYGKVVDHTKQQAANKITVIFNEN